MKSLEGLTLEEVDRNLWRKILNESEYATVFHSLEWIEIQKDVFKFKEIIISSNKCIFPIFFKRKGPFKIYGSPLPETGSFYGGPICADASSYAQILKNIRISGIFTSLFIKTPCGFNPNIYGGDITIEPVRNYILHIKGSEEDIWRNLNKKTRNAVRKAEKSGVEVRICGAEELHTYYSMVEEVVKRRTHTPIPQELMKKVLNSGIGKLFMAYYKGKPASGGIFLTFKDTVTYWSGASFSKFRKYQPSNLLHWEVIRWARDKGYRYYDLGGAEIPSIAKFKRGWGGEEVYYYRVFKEGSIAKTARVVYSRLRKYRAVSRLYGR